MVAPFTPGATIFSTNKKKDYLLTICIPLIPQDGKFYQQIHFLHNSQKFQQRFLDNLVS